MQSATNENEPVVTLSWFDVVTLDALLGELAQSVSPEDTAAVNQLRDELKLACAAYDNADWLESEDIPEMPDRPAGTIDLEISRAELDTLIRLIEDVPDEVPLRLLGMNAARAIELAVIADTQPDSAALTATRTRLLAQILLDRAYLQAHQEGPSAAIEIAYAPLAAYWSGEDAAFASELALARLAALGAVAASGVPDDDALVVARLALEWDTSTYGGPLLSLPLYEAGIDG